MSKPDRLSSLLKNLEQIYLEIPGVPCQSCGECCVSPTVTLLEFIYLMDGFLAENSMEQATEILCRPAAFHPTCEGNLICRMQAKRLCTIHKHRTMACRIHGLPVLQSLQIAGQEDCLKMKGILPQVETADLKSWLELLSAMNSQVMEYYTEPYWLAGLNLEGWLAAYFDPLLDAGPFGQAKAILRGRYAQLAGVPYTDASRLKDKVDKITLLFEMFKIGPSPELVALIDSIERDYPLTGTYYMEEAKKIRAAIQPIEEV